MSLNLDAADPNSWFAASPDFFTRERMRRVAELGRSVAQEVYDKHPDVARQAAIAMARRHDVDLDNFAPGRVMRAYLRGTMARLAPSLYEEPRMETTEPARRRSAGMEDDGSETLEPKARGLSAQRKRLVAPTDGLEVVQWLMAE